MGRLDDPKTDKEKHAYAKLRGRESAILLSRSMYERAEREGWDMRDYVIQKPMPSFAAEFYRDMK